MQSDVQDCTVIDFAGLADRLGVSLQTIARMRAAGDFPRVINLSTRRKGVLQSDLREWLASRREPAL